MQGKIDVHGKLYLERNYVLRSLNCPVTKHEFCGDWCVLFGEPIKKLKMVGTVSTELIYVELCQKTIVFTEFKDER
jgi:hypothetical protein